MRSPHHLRHKTIEQGIQKEIDSFDPFFNMYISMNLVNVNPF